MRNLPPDIRQRIGYVTEGHRLYRRMRIGELERFQRAFYPGQWNGAWPEIINWHIEHWAYNDLARKYATDDVVYTRDLYKHFKCYRMD